MFEMRDRRTERHDAYVRVCSAHQNGMHIEPFVHMHVLLCVFSSCNYFADSTFAIFTGAKWQIKQLNLNNASTSQTTAVRKHSNNAVLIVEIIGVRGVRNSMRCHVPEHRQCSLLKYHKFNLLDFAAVPRLSN